ncbi:Na/Pi cotransporter family protein [Mycoplasma sp. P36-A1]|uniref:Na/Pi cotransporter family protein n=1 Tax=Mycoplasma sp. P36-A1 TaxID=3252900 RepID=UPI003C2FED65
MQEFISQAQDVNFDLLKVFAGLGLFLFGIKMMGDMLKILAGSGMKSLIDKYTTNPVKAVFVGAATTALIQSSSGTTALTISLVRSGLMNLKQAIGIIMGANIGTTITAILIGFNMTAYAPYFLVVGAFMMMFSKKPKTEHIASLIFSFGCLFYGLDVMGSALKVLADMPLFHELTTQLSNHSISGVLLGVAMTLLIQSSSATIGILQSLYNDGLIDLKGTLPILFGDNIGTTITAILAAVGGTIAAKRAATAHVLFNVIGTSFFMLIYPFFLKYVEWAADGLHLNRKMQIAFAHSSFNIATTIALLPCIGIIAAIVSKIWKEKNEDDFVPTVVLDTSIIAESPNLAVQLAKNATKEMSRICLKMTKRTKEYVVSKDYKLVEKIEGYEEVVNDLNSRISDYLTEISSYPLSPEDNATLNDLLYTLKDLERIGDHCINIMESFEEIYGAKQALTPLALADMLEMFDVCEGILDNINEIIETFNQDFANNVSEKEDVLDSLERNAKQSYMERVKNKEKMDPIPVTLYVDILSDLERIGDLSYNISSRGEKNKFNKH